MYPWQAVSRREISVQPPVNPSPFVSCSPDGLTKGRHSSSQWKTVVRKLLDAVDERGSRDLGQPVRTSAPHGSRPGAAAARRDETLHLGYGEVKGAWRGLRGERTRHVTMEMASSVPSLHAGLVLRRGFYRIARVVRGTREKGTRRSSVIGRVPLPVNIITPRNCRTPV